MREYERPARFDPRPLTEGYQPGAQSTVRGAAPTSCAKPDAPPSGGSSASRPLQASAVRSPASK